MAAYVTAAIVLSLAQGLGMNFISANLTQIQGSLGATTNEATWLMAAYMAPNASLSLILIKMRTQFGLRRFAEVAIVVFVGIAFIHLFVHDFQTTLVLRFFAGAAAAPMSSLGFLYMLENFPPAKKMNIGLCLALTNISLAAPVARIISPPLLDIGGWHALNVLELALALLALGFVFLLPLTPVPRAKVISTMDVVSYLFIALGLGFFAVAFTVGRLYWWTEAPWLGVLLVCAIASVTVAAIIELNRESPLIDVRWLFSKEVLHFTGVLLIFRIALTEQSTGAVSLFTTLGLAPYQNIGLWVAILVASVVAGLVCAMLMKPGQDPAPLHAISLLLIGTGAWMDAHATSLTRPEQMMLSQVLISAGGAFFLPPAMASGLMSALKKGPNYILSFVIVFLTTQSVGGLFGSAVMGSFVTLREKVHSSYLVEHIALTDPLVAQRITQLGGAYGNVLTDKTLLNAEGMALLSQQATREAYVLAHNDLFMLTTALCALALLGLVIHKLFDALRRRYIRPAEASA
jgi:MFS family permease